MANTNSSTSLYSFTSNVKVSPNNFTTLYSSKPGNISTGNVGDRNFTTLYTQQSDIKPTRPYGNANVESFLNVGHDSGGNTVQSINMSNNLTVGGQSYLGDVSNVHIEGGNLSFVLSTDGNGNLEWVAQTSAGEGVPYIHFDVPSDGTNQTFTNNLLINYATVNDMAVMKNGVNIEPSQYSINGNQLTILIQLLTGDTVDVLPSGGSSSFQPGGSATQIQYNNGTGFAGNSHFTYDQVQSTVNVNGNIITQNFQVGNNAILGYASNVHIFGGVNGYVLQTDGLGGLSWTEQTGGGGNGVPGGSNTQIQINVEGAFGADANLTFVSQTLHTPFIEADGSLLSNITGSNVSGYVNNANHATISNIANVAYSVNGSNVSGDVSGANHANISDVAYSISGSNVSGDVSGANHANIADVANSVAVANIVGIGNIATINLDGSSSNVLYGNGVWSAIPVTPVANYANYAGNVTISTQPNITSLGTLTSLTVAGMTSIQETKEKFIANGTGATGTVFFDVLTSAIILQTANATSNFTLGIRGNSITTFDSIANVGDSISISYINKNASTIYYANVINIDGNSITPTWINGVNPGSIVSTSTYDMYNLNILKTAGNTYTVFGSFGSYS